jgi:hypothetical protein
MGTLKKVGETKKGEGEDGDVERESIMVGNVACVRGGNIAGETVKEVKDGAVVVNQSRVAAKGGVPRSQSVVTVKTPSLARELNDVLPDAVTDGKKYIIKHSHIIRPPGQEPQIGSCEPVPGSFANWFARIRS